MLFLFVLTNVREYGESDHAQITMIEEKGEKGRSIEEGHLDERKTLPALDGAVFGQLEETRNQTAVTHKEKALFLNSTAAFVLNAHKTSPFSFLKPSSFKIEKDCASLFLNNACSYSIGYRGKADGTHLKDQ